MTNQCNKRKPWPDNIRELLEWYYNPECYNIRTRYEDKILAEIFSPLRESIVKDLFKELGEVKKIPESKEKSFDFIIEKVNLLIEVTSINIKPDKNNLINTDEKKFISKIERAIHHAEEKTYPKCDECFKIVVIFLYIFIQINHSYIDIIYSIKDKIDLMARDVDAVIFMPDPAYIVSQEGEISIEPIAYVKNETLVDLLSKIKRKFKVIIINY